MFFCDFFPNESLSHPALTLLYFTVAFCNKILIFLGLAFTEGLLWLIVLQRSSVFLWQFDFVEWLCSFVKYTFQCPPNTHQLVSQNYWVSSARKWFLFCTYFLGVTKYSLDWWTLNQLRQCRVEPENLSLLRCPELATSCILRPTLFFTTIAAIMVSL